ncbi:MAG: glycosyltransferase [Pseudomonadales bacterium]|nr:glycosyltransferase [Pseudomonadales bacterium]
MSDDKRLNICHVLLSRGFAGSERSTAESCNEQVKSHSVCLIVKKSNRKSGKSILDYLDSRVEIVEVASVIMTQYQIQKAIRRFRPDIVHCHLRRATRILSKIKTQAALVSTLHIGVNGKHFYNMDGLVCNARWQVESIAKEFKGIVFKANNSLSPHRRLTSDERTNLRKQFGFNDQQLLIGAVGRLHESKAWDTLIAAYKKLSNQRESVLTFFGSGGLEEKLKSQAGIASNIRFFGHQDNIKNIYQMFDLLVCPSRFEPLPRVMLEGYDAGVPIIASNAGGCGELIEDYGGDVFEVDNVDALVVLLQSFIDNPKASHRPDLSSHYIETANQAMLTFYQQCINHRVNY